MMTEEEILEKVDSKIADNLYRVNGDLFTQYQGQLVNVLELDADVLKDITDYDKVKDHTTGKMVENEQETTVEATCEVEYVEHEPEQQSGVEQSGVIQLADDLDNIAGLYDQYEELKRKIIKKSDIENIQGNKFYKKSAWRKVATAFNISDEIIEEEKEELEGGGVRYKIVTRATAPNGRSTIGVGMCDTEENNRKDRKEHDIYATAHTRSKNRAISDLLGGEVSAEEIE